MAASDGSTKEGAALNEFKRGIIRLKANDNKQAANDWGIFDPIRDDFLRICRDSVQDGHVLVTLDVVLTLFFGAPIERSGGMPEMAARLGEYIGNLIGFDYIGIE